MNAGTPLSERLRHPARTLTPEELAAQWFHQCLEVRLTGYGVLADRTGILNKVRGALGRALMESASKEALAGNPCPWSPPCGLDVFFREQLRIGRHGLPKPLVLSFDRARRDLVVRCTVFGLACDWAPVLQDHLVSALLKRIPWSRAAPDISLPEPNIAHARLRTVSGLGLAEVPGAVEISFLSPVDASATDPLDAPHSLIGRLVRRIDGLARWQDAGLELDWPGIDAASRELDYDVSGLRRRQQPRRMGRAGKNLNAPTLSGVLAVGGDLRPVWPFLVVGETCHMGRGAVQGLGRYRLCPDPPPGENNPV